MKPKRSSGGGEGGVRGKTLDGSGAERLVTLFARSVRMGVVPHAGTEVGTVIKRRQWWSEDEECGAVVGGVELAFFR